MRVCVAGAGAIGRTIAARLAASGAEVSLLARGAALDEIGAHGVRLDDTLGTVAPRVRVSAGAVFGVQDAVFLCSKAQDLPALAETIQPLIGAETMLVPMVNGVPFWYFAGEGGRFDGSIVQSVDPGGAILGALPARRVIGAVAFMNCEIMVSGMVVARTPHRIVLGEPHGGLSPRLHALCATLEKAGIAAPAAKRIRDPLWLKIAGNVSTNPLSVVSGATLEEMFSRPDLLARLTAIMHEAMLTACCHGARFTIDPIEIVARGKALGPFRTSMLQDHQRGRPLELGAIGDAVVELGACYALPMHATRAVLREARAAAISPCSR